MQSKNAKAHTRAESEHIDMVKELPCSVCDEPPPSQAHHIVQGQHFTVVALCESCHMPPAGWHGTKLLWRVGKIDELDALNITLGRLHARA